MLPPTVPSPTSVVAAKGVILALLLAYTVILWNIFAGQVGLSYDEALNYGTYASRGVIYSLTHYREPNNHLLITSLNALIPESVVRAWPPIMRLWLPGFVGTVAYAFWAFLRHHLSWSRSRAMLVALALPLSTTSAGMHLLWTRGYLPGMALLLLGMHSFVRACRLEGWLDPAGAGIASTGQAQREARRWQALAILWFSLSIWCVPSYILPVWISLVLTALYAFFAAGRAVAFRYILFLPLTLALGALLYSGVLTQMPAASKGWVSDWSLVEAFRRILPLGRVAVVGGLAYPLVAVAVPAIFVFRDVRRRRALSWAPYDAAHQSPPDERCDAEDAPLETRRSFLLLLVFGVAFLSPLSVEVAVRLGMMPAPYIRNVIFLAPFFWFGLVMLPGLAGRLALLVVLCLVPFVVWDLSGLSGSRTWNLKNPTRENTVDRALRARRLGLPCGEECGHEGRLFETLDGRRLR